MSEEEKKAKKPAAKKTAGDARKPASKKTSAKKPAEKEAPPKPAPEKEEKAAEEAAAGPAPEKEAAAARPPEAAPEAEPKAEPEEQASEGAGAPGEEEMSPEEFQKFLEEQMEKITVREIVERLMMDMASLAYQKMGLPEQVNMKYRDFDQARMAIDALKGLLGAIEGKVPEEEAKPFRATLANLQMNFVRLAKPGG